MMSKARKVNKVSKIKGFFDRTVVPGVAHSPDYCDDFEDCPSVLTPSEALLRLQAGGQIADLKARRLYYDDEDYQQYVDDPEFVDYFTKYREHQAAKIQAWKNRNYKDKEAVDGLQETKSSQESKDQKLSGRIKDSQEKSEEKVSN